MFSLQKQTAKLSAFNPQLKASLYAKSDHDDIEPGHLPSLKFPKMSPFKWAKDFAGYETTIHYGVSEKDNIILLDCQLDKIKFDCQDGGTVLMNFRIKAHPEERDSGRLCGMIQQDIEITLTPPEVAQ